MMYRFYEWYGRTEGGELWKILWFPSDRDASSRDRAGANEIPFKRVCDLKKKKNVNHPRNEIVAFEILLRCIEHRARFRPTN